MTYYGGVNCGGQRPKIIKIGPVDQKKWGDQSIFARFSRANNLTNKQTGGGGAGGEILE